MLALQAETQAAKAETLRLVPLPQHMEVAAVAQVQGLPLTALEVAEAVSAQRGQALVRPVLTVQVAAGTALPSQPAPRLAVLVVALEQALLQIRRLPYTRATEALEAEAEAVLMHQTSQQEQQEPAARATWKLQALQQVQAV